MADPLKKWARDRTETIKELRKLGRDILYHAGNAKIASAVGGGTATVAGIGAVVCYAAAPFTFGGSLVPAAALTGVAVAGGATSLGASITNHFIEKGYMKSVQEALDKDRHSFKKLMEAVDKAKEITLEDGIRGGVKVGKTAPSAVRLAAFVSRRLVVSERAAAGLLRLGRTARFAGHAFTVVALPLDIIFFVKDIVDLVKGNVSEVAKEVMELADKLQKELDEILADAK